MSRQAEMKQAKKWLYDNAEFAAQWAIQTAQDLTVSGAFYTKEQLYGALEDTLMLLTPERTGRQDITPLPQSDFARRMIVANVAYAVTRNSISRDFETPHGMETRYTTDELLQAEQTIFKQATEMAATSSEGQPYTDLGKIKSAVAEMVHVIDIGVNYAYDMPSDFLKVFDDFLKPGNLRIANGPPGSGKSTLAQGLLYALTKDAVENGGRVPDFYAGAPSEKAAADIVNDMNLMKAFSSLARRDEIAEKMPVVQGFSSLDEMIRTLQSGKVKKGSVVVIDEAGLMGSKHMASLLAAANKSQVRLFMMGDNLQIPPKMAGNGFDLLLQNRNELGVDVCELDVIMRQKSKGEAQWTMDIRNGDPLKALKGYANRRYTYDLSNPWKPGFLFSDQRKEGMPGLQMQEDKNAVYERLTQDFIEYITKCPGGSYVVMGTDESSAEELNLYMHQKMKEAGVIQDVINYGTPDKPFEIGKGDTLILNTPLKMQDAQAGEQVEISAGTQLMVTGTAKDVLSVQNGGRSFQCSSKELCANSKYGLALPLYQAQGQSKDRSFLAIDKKGCMDKVYGGVAFSRHVRQMSAYVSKQAYPTLDFLGAEMSVFKTRQPLLSDNLGQGILKENPKQTREKVVSFFQQGYNSDNTDRSRAINAKLIHARKGR